MKTEKDKENKKNKKELYDTPNYNLGSYVKIVKVGFYGTIILILLISFVRIMNSTYRLHKNGWSFTSRTKTISVSEPEYDEAIEYWFNMDYPKAEISFKNALNEAYEKNGSDSTESAAIEEKLGTFYLEVGKYDESYEYLNSAYVTFRKRLGDADGNTIVSRAQIAICDIKKGNTESGFATLNELYDQANYYVYKIQICQMLARCNTELGNYEKAKEWYDILGYLYSEFAPRSTARAELINDYAVLMMTLGEYQQAIDNCNYAIDILNEIDSKEDPTMANVYTNLSKAYAMNNQNRQSDEAQKKALEIQKEIYGENNIHVALSYDAMAKTYSVMHDKSKQEEYLKKALEISTDSVGENHMTSAIVYKDYGDFYKSEDKLDKAVKYHKKALEIRKNILGINNRETILIYEALADDYRLNGEYDIGMENAEYAIDISESLYGRENLNSAHSYITASWVYSDANQDEKAYQLAKMALDICDRQRDNSKLIRPDAYQAMGYVYLNKDDYNNAIKYLYKATNLYKDTQENKGQKLGTTELYLGDAYFKVNDYDNCFISLIDAMEILSNEEVNPDLSESINKRLEMLYNSTESDIEYEEWINNQKRKLIHREGEL